MASEWHSAKQVVQDPEWECTEGYTYTRRAIVQVGRPRKAPPPPPPPGGGGGRSPYDLLRTRFQKKRRKGAVFRHTASSTFFLKKGCFFPLYRHLGVLFRKVGFDPFRHSEQGAGGKI